MSTLSYDLIFIDNYFKTFSSPTGRENANNCRMGMLRVYVRTTRRGGKRYKVG